MGSIFNPICNIYVLMFLPLDLLLALTSLCPCWLDSWNSLDLSHGENNVLSFYLLCLVSIQIHPIQPKID